MQALRARSAGMPSGSLVLSLLISLAATTDVHAQGANLIDATYGVGTGSFEIGNYQATGIGFMRLSAGATDIAGWTVGGQSGVDWVSAPVHGILDGSKAVDLKGTTTGAFGEVSTTIPTDVGGKYRIQLGCYAGESANTGTISAGSLQGQSFTGPIGPAATAQYDVFEYTFTALSSSTLLTLRSLSSDGFGPVVDDVRVSSDAWTDLGGGLAGVSGIPLLSGAGSLVGGTAGALDLNAAHPSALSLLFAALSSAPISFKGGILQAFPPAVTVQSVTDGIGELHLPFVWPTGVPSATSLYFQYAIKDAAAIHGVALSNALKGLTP